MPQCDIVKILILLAACPVSCCLSMPAGVDHMQKLLWGHYSVLTRCVYLITTKWITCTNTNYTAFQIYHYNYGYNYTKIVINYNYQLPLQQHCCTCTCLYTWYSADDNNPFSSLGIHTSCIQPTHYTYTCVQELCKLWQTKKWLAMIKINQKSGVSAHMNILVEIEFRCSRP